MWSENNWMGMLNDDAVVIKEEGDNTLITVNCPDKTGLGSDLCRIILLFGLSITKGGISFFLQENNISDLGFFWISMGKNRLLFVVLCACFGSSKDDIIL